MGRLARFNDRSFQRPPLPVQALDALGRPLQIGDSVVLPQEAPGVLMTVVDIKPCLEPGVPANVVDLVLRAVVPIRTLSTAPVGQVLLVAPVELPELPEMNGQEGIVEP